MICPACKRETPRAYAGRCWTCHSALVCTSCLRRHVQKDETHRAALADPPDTPVLEANLDRR